MKTEPIDAVEMTRRIRDEMYEETKHLEGDALLRYIQRKGQPASNAVQERDARQKPKPSQVSAR